MVGLPLLGRIDSVTVILIDDHFCHIFNTPVLPDYTFVFGQC